MAATPVIDLIVNNRNYLQPYAISLTKDIHSSEDLVQETICKALYNQEKYLTGTNIKAWLYTIMKNIFINDWRKKAKHGRMVEIDSVKTSYTASVAVNKAEGNLLNKEINTVMFNLPNALKTPFVMFVEGYKYAEIAEFLQLPIGTIKSRIFFARKILKQQLLIS